MLEENFKQIIYLAEKCGCSHLRSEYIFLIDELNKDYGPTRAAIVLNTYIKALKILVDIDTTSENRISLFSGILNSYHLFVANTNNFDRVDIYNRLVEMPGDQLILYSIGLIKSMEYMQANNRKQEQSIKKEVKKSSKLCNEAFKKSLGILKKPHNRDKIRCYSNFDKILTDFGIAK